ncbi:cation:proton antiporter [Streptomyces sp. VNUA116]|uniref:cation:proton antiporter n=1 Tax=Streptomyces sp. VNUA116 TaxID=3062449 RepID=UPI0026747CAF|nr:cation:proton antiporter [Streptomyces sp. VNUA116]WKU48816.1 cation:proton antiporter [Streptomyces sp. VNUA116]
MAIRNRMPPRWLPESVPGIVVGGAGALVLGAAIGRAADLSALIGTGGYVFGAGLLLAIGLFGSTYAIDLRALREDLPGVVAAVTLGVVLKASLIAGVMVLAFGRSEYVVLGIAVAQIDPLSVAALGRDGRMSPRARSLLSGWASFDDPMTVLLTLYVAGYAYAAAGHEGAPAAAGGGAGGYASGLALNAALLAGVLLLWWAGRRAAPLLPSSPRARRTGVTLAGLLVVTMLVIAAANMLMLAVGVAGLFLRTKAFDKALDRAVGGAFLVAFLALGLFLARGVDVVPGFVLGLAAFGAQAVVALGVMPLFVRGLDRRDRIALGLGQQNGITAVLIALTLERDFPGTVAIVGPAVITVNLLHGTAQVLSAHPPRFGRGQGDKEERDPGSERPLPQEEPTGQGPLTLGSLARSRTAPGPVPDGRSPA